ncbi:MAG: ABC transporter ATP-binding protein, partial [Myxococcaceae bacterium]|nr:ABC transporter ATP-binding protein [Myxococcaceae bacterium]
THDRYFLDKVASSILALEGDGRVTRYEGNWSMYRRLRPTTSAAPGRASKPAAEAPAPPPRKPGRLGYEEQRELDGMEAAIERAEADKRALELRLADPSVMSNAVEVARLSSALDAAAQAVDRLYERWQTLQSLGEGR